VSTDRRDAVGGGFKGLYGLKRVGLSLSASLVLSRWTDYQHQPVMTTPTSRQATHLPVRCDTHARRPSVSGAGVHVTAGVA